MQFAVLLYADAGLGPDSPEWEQSLPHHQAFAERMREHDPEFSGAPLQASTAATSVRVRGGERLVTDGPFAETKEQLWGFYLVNVPDIDTVLDASAGLWEAEHGTVEIRPAVPTPS